MRIMVTGVAGFIGSTLAERLVQDGFDVTGIDCFTGYYSPALKHANIEGLLRSPRFRLIESDLGDVDGAVLNVRSGRSIPLPGVIVMIRDITGRNIRVGYSGFEKGDMNYGQTAAFDAGLRAGRGKYLATMDGDLQNDPADLPVLMKSLDAADLVCGYRRRRSDTIIRKISSRIANGVRNWATGDTIIDVGCSLRVMRRECIERIKLYEGMHRFFSTLVKMEGFRVMQIPVNHRGRMHGRTKYNITNRLFKALCDLFAVLWMQRRHLRYVIREKN